MWQTAPAMMTEQLLPAVCAAIVLAASGCHDASSTAHAKAATVPSWLEHLGLKANATRLGQAGGLPPASDTPRHEPRFEGYRDQAMGSFTLTGADVYRLSCRACHGPWGRGAPPGIPSVLGPARAMSVTLLKKRMQKAGAATTPDRINHDARQARRQLLGLVQHGGAEMPPFAYLRPAELDGLLQYLEQLANVPDAPTHLTPLTLTANRVGMLMVRGNCSICHGAGGSAGDSMMMMGGPAPALQNIPHWPILVVIRKIHQGSSGMSMLTQVQTNMPAFPYFSTAEINAAYTLLATQPPAVWERKWPPRP